MATESLIIELDARTKLLDAKLQSVDGKLERLEDQTKKNDKAFVSLGSAAKGTITVLAKVATAVLAVSAAVTAMTLSSAKNRKELELLSKQAKTSADDFQGLAFATSQYGINAEQIADISKDIADKIGEFAAAGTGTFQDYADVMKLTKEEAKSTALAFEGLSSQEVIGKMVSEMEAAGVSGDRMTFVLESMGNDLSKIQPLFAKNSEELTKLKDRFRLVNEELQITDLQAEKLKEVSTSYQLMTTQIGNATTAISATLAPVMDDFFNDVISVVPQATQTIIDFVNSFLDAENITTQAGITQQLEASQKRMIELQKEAAQLASEDHSNRKDSGEAQQRGLKILTESINAEKIRTEELSIQARLLEDQRVSMEDAVALRGGEIGGGTASGTGTGDQKQAIIDRFKDEETLLDEKLERELAVVGDNNDLMIELKDAHLAAVVALHQAEEDEITDITAKAISDRAKLENKAGKAKSKLDANVAKNTVNLIEMIGGKSKAAALAGLAVQKAAALSANATATISGGQLAYASQLIPGDPSSVGRGLAAQASVHTMGAVNAGLIIATGLGQAAGIASGGGDGGSGGGSGSDYSSQQQQPDFVPETSSLELTEQSGGQGITTQRLIISTDDGTDIFDTFARGINENNRNGG